MFQLDKFEECAGYEAKTTPSEVFQLQQHVKWRLKYVADLGTPSSTHLLHLVRISSSLILILGSILHLILHPGIPSCTRTPCSTSPSTTAYTPCCSPHELLHLEPHLALRLALCTPMHRLINFPIEHPRTPSGTCTSMHHLMNSPCGKEDLKVFPPIGSSQPDWIQSGIGRLKISGKTFSEDHQSSIRPPIGSNRGLDSPESPKYEGYRTQEKVALWRLIQGSSLRIRELSRHLEPKPLNLALNNTR